MIEINLHQVQMRVISTATNGVVNRDTIFRFTQKGRMVTAEYLGGKIKKGFLVGLISANKLSFNYCQLQTDDTLDNGSSTSELALGEHGKIRLTEHFEWSSRPGELGVNIFEEI